MIDFTTVDTLLEGFNQSTGFVTAILDLDGNVLSKSGWRKICTQFHRINPDTARKCTISDTVLAGKMGEGEKFHAYKCLNGLVDVAVPIVIRGEHVANLFSGQFFFEHPDISHFKKQAAQYGFDEKSYLDALSQVPVVSLEKVNNVMHFLLNMTQLISEMAFQNLELSKLNNEREKNERALQKLTQHRQLALDAASLGWWQFNAVTGIPAWDKRTKDILGVDQDREPNKELINTITHPEDLPMLWHQLEEALSPETSEPFFSEHRIVRPDGEVRWIEVHGIAAFEDNNGKRQAAEFIGTIADITERKTTEFALKESEERFRKLHNASFGGIVIHDKGFILECNKGLSDITGYEYGELIGMDGLLLISPDTRDKVLNHIHTGYEQPYEAKGIRKNGELYPLRLEARAIPYKGKEVRVVEFRDISPEKKAEKEKENLESQLRQAQKIEAIGRLAGGVAHDFNNMLGVIIGHAEMALETLDPAEPLYTDLDEIRKAADRSADLTRHLLAFARKQNISPVVIDLNKTLSGMSSMLKRLIGEDIDLAWLPGEDIWSVKMDPSQLDQILANLCVNARDAIEDVGKVSIETANVQFDETYCENHVGFLPGEYVCIAVSDNGCGIEKEHLDSLFEPFFTTKKAGKGTGLGLATVYGIIKQNKGFINTYSEPGYGTTFKIYIPRYKADATHSSTMKSDLPDETGHETILLVEDEPAILKITTTMLKKMGYQVLPAESPGEAIRLASQHAGEIQLLLTDVIMPEMNGRDLAQKIVSFSPGIKKLFMSGYTANVIAHHGVLESGVHFIPKPFTRHALGVKIREVLESAPL